MQRKLKEEDAKLLYEAADIIQGCFDWSDTDEGAHFWFRVVELLRNKASNRTSDGKPYVDPEPPIPEGYRKAEPDEWQRKDVKTWEGAHDFSRGNWAVRPSHKVGKPFNTSPDFYIVPIDPPLTDHDACVWPRRLVMVRDIDRHPWIGPYKYLGKTDASYSIDPNNGGCATDWKQARPATPAEIEAASNKS
jgi:hypothetical protein